ncbi:MAG: FeoA domain-containing protein [Clostridiales Family XIII bacterium]|jgi:Fe2+ transport system protein FeoA|nr:FeoA domain-containing protein [Clostridiales Family XIII bacterium]
MTIDQLAPGEGGIIEYVGGQGELRDRLLDMGLTPGTYVFLRKTAPMGDPIQLSLRGYELTIRKADAARLGVSRPRDVSLNPFKPCYGDCKNCIESEAVRAERPAKEPGGAGGAGEGGGDA